MHIEQGWKNYTHYTKGGKSCTLGQEERKQERTLRTSNGKELHAEILREFCVDVQTNQRGVLQSSPRKLDQELAVAGVGGGGVVGDDGGEQRAVVARVHASARGNRRRSHTPRKQCACVCV
jgi:hypothetical protein